MLLSAPIPPAFVAHGRTVAEPRLSRDGTRLGYVTVSAGRAALAVIPLGPGGALAGPEAIVTADPPPSAPHPYGGGTFDWTPDGSELVYVANDGALYRVPSVGGRSRLVCKPVGGESAAAPTVSPDGRWVAFQQEGDKAAIAVVSLEEGAPWPVRVSSSVEPDFAFDPDWAPDGSSLVWHEWDVPAMPWDAGRLMSVRFDPVSGTPIGLPSLVTGGNDVSLGQPRYSADGRHVGYVSDLRGWKNVHVCDRAVETHRAIAFEEFEHAGPTWGPGQRTFVWSPDGTKIAFSRNEGGFGRLCVVDIADGTVTELGKGVHLALSWTGTGGGRIAALRTGGRTPTQIVVYDVDSGERHTAARGPIGGWEAMDLPEPEVVHWKGSDGADVHGRIYRPSMASVASVASTASVGPGQNAVLPAPPMIVSIHGGPTGQDMVSFNARIAFWISRGWVIFVPDHRGSTGWGRSYQQAMRGRWGDLDIDDSAAGIRHAIAQGWCDPRRVVAMGGSAGGFTVLGVLARHPELCAAGVDLFGVADLLDLDETTHRYEKHYLHSLIGPLPAAADLYRDRSPVNYSERITAPLLILQGEADKVVPPAQSRAIAEAIRRRGGVVETHFYEGEGHGWGRPETVVDELTRTEDFLRRHVLRWRT